MASVKYLLLKLCHLRTKAITFWENQTIEITALKSNRANSKYLSVANDSDKILEESDNGSYVRDNRYN